MLFSLFSPYKGELLSLFDFDPIPCLMHPAPGRGVEPREKRGRRRGESQTLPAQAPRRPWTPAGPSGQLTPPPSGVHLHPARDRAGARPRAPLIGRAGPLVTLFCLSGHRIKAAAAAVGTALSGLSYPSLAESRGWGGRCGAAPRAASGRLAAGDVPVLFPCRAAETGGRHPRLARPEGPQPTEPSTGKGRGGDGWAAKRGGARVLGGSPLGESSAARRG